MTECVDHISIRKCLIDYNEPLSLAQRVRAWCVYVYVIRVLIVVRAHLAPLDASPHDVDFMPNYTYLSIAAWFSCHFSRIQCLNQYTCETNNNNNKIAIAGSGNVMARKRQTSPSTQQKCGSLFSLVNFLRRTNFHGVFVSFRRKIASHRRRHRQRSSVEWVW